MVKRCQNLGVWQVLNTTYGALQILYDDDDDDILAPYLVSTLNLFIF